MDAAIFLEGVSGNALKGCWAHRRICEPALFGYKWRKGWVPLRHLSYTNHTHCQPAMRPPSNRSEGDPQRVALDVQLTLVGTSHMA